MKRSKTQPIFISAFMSLTIEIRLLLAISVSSVLLIELILKDIPAPTITMFRLGEIYLKVAYAFTTSILFYFINVQYTKQVKKIKGYLLIANPLGIIHGLLYDIHSTLFTYESLLDHGSGAKRITEEMYQEAFKQIEVKKPVYIWGILGHRLPLPGGTTWEGFFKEKLAGIQNIIKTELYPLLDLFDIEVLSKYRMMSDLINQIENYPINGDMSITEYGVSRTLKYTPHMIQKLTELSEEVNSQFRKQHLHTRRQYDLLLHKRKLKKEQS